MCFERKHFSPQMAELRGSRRACRCPRGFHFRKLLKAWLEVDCFMMEHEVVLDSEERPLQTGTHRNTGRLMPSMPTVLLLQLRQTTRSLVGGI